MRRTAPSAPGKPGIITNGTSAPSSRSANGNVKIESKNDVKPATTTADGMDIDSEDEMAAQMKKIMGFAKFKTTKETKVPGNDKLYAVRKEKQMVARQYMNRVGGFNRPLSPS
jgi:U4/U6.U5 tri-snRNP-associated protein 3